MEFELYLQKFKITSWKNGEVYKTEPVGYDWFLQSEVQANIPSETNILYTAANDLFAKTNMTIRPVKDK